MATASKHGMRRNKDLRKAFESSLYSHHLFELRLSPCMDAVVTKRIFHLKKQTISYCCFDLKDPLDWYSLKKN